MIDTLLLDSLLPLFGSYLSALFPLFLLPFLCFAFVVSVPCLLRYIINLKRY